MIDTLIVYKLDHHGREVWRYPGRVLARDAGSIRLEGFFNRDDTLVGPAVFKRGDRLVETFYSDRWYNVFAVYDRDDGALKGWYCNVTRPATITGDAVSSDDLALDVWVSPDGAVAVLDEDEFAALELSDDEREAARQALRELVELARTALVAWGRGAGAAGACREVNPPRMPPGDRRPPAGEKGATQGMAEADTGRPGPPTEA
ncbi:MAG: DUF402 domain-containing protein [Candidatus Promineofilum sp.]|nr:DUF402 domain-containing protein [Promineifilum sp.]